MTVTAKYLSDLGLSDDYILGHSVGGASVLGASIGGAVVEGSSAFQSGQRTTVPKTAAQQPQYVSTAGYPAQIPDARYPARGLHP